LASIGHLAAGVGHEINNPLAIILGNITLSEDLLRDSGIPHEKISERFTKMKNAIQRIANIVKSLRTFARSDNNLVSLFDPCALAEETVEMLKELYIKEDVTLSFSGVKQPLMLNGNKGRIQQVMINLIMNAKDATIGKAKRNVDVFVSFESNEVKVVVADNGCGVPDHLKEKIFSPFFTTKEVNQGTGIGLALVSATIKEHHGRLELETKLDVGSKFIFTIPVVMDLSQPQVTSPLVSTKAKLSKIECTVMLVDDEPELRDVFQIMLSKICRNVIVAESAEAGLKLLQKGSVDLIISDIKMSGLDGFEFLELVRLNETISQPRFMFITGGIEISKEEQLIITEQTDGVLNKPISEEDVYKKLSELFNLN
jgi:CheY-like chemotaxis protein